MFISVQITVGGYKANDAAVPQDACNAITIMCLKASRRLPLNAPCLSLRMHKNMPQEVTVTNALLTKKKTSESRNLLALY